MSLLREIQRDLMQGKSEISPVLLKLRYLASRLGSDMLEDWVKYEMEGYPNAVDVPDYRKVPVSYHATFNGEFGIVLNNVPVPLSVIKKFCGDQWVPIQMRKSVAEIDYLLIGEDSGSLALDASSLIFKLQGNIYEDMACNSVTGTIPKSALVGLQYAVRSKILELTMGIEKSIPAAIEVEVGGNENLSSQETNAVTKLTKQIFYGNVTNINSSGGDNSRINLHSTDGSNNFSG